MFQVLRSAALCAITDLLPRRQALKVAIDIHVNYVKSGNTLRLTGKPG